MTLAEFLSIRNSKKAIKSDEKIVKRIEEALGNNKIFQGEVTDQSCGRLGLGESEDKLTVKREEGKVRVRFKSGGGESDGAGGILAVKRGSKK